MKDKTRRFTYQTDCQPAMLRRLTRFLAQNYGQPEGYGLCFDLGRELWGSTFRCRDRGRLVSLDSTRYPSTGRTETLLTVRVCNP